jgi:hypothetical protein
MTRKYRRRTSYSRRRGTEAATLRCTELARLPSQARGMPDRGLVSGFFFIVHEPAIFPSRAQPFQSQKAETPRVVPL